MKKAQLFVLAIAIAIISYLLLNQWVVDLPIQNRSGLFTVRVNTFRRNDLLKQFLDHYSQCEGIKVIQVVWSDQDNEAPLHWEKNYSEGKVKFELQKTNSLSNRFRALLEVPTDGVMSVDDDIIIPCDNLASSFQVWQANQRSLVGYSARMNSFDPNSGDARYLRWQHTWWSGLYSIVLTKVSFLHKDYMSEYFRIIPVSFLEYIDKHRNCEDLAMAYVIASVSQSPPVWVKGYGVQETSSSGISSGVDHFIQRGHCLDALESMIAEEQNKKRASSEKLYKFDKAIHPWKTGYQKYVYVNWFWEILRRRTDPK